MRKPPESPRVGGVWPPECLGTFPSAPPTLALESTVPNSPAQGCQDPGDGSCNSSFTPSPRAQTLQHADLSRLTMSICTLGVIAAHVRKSCPEA